MLVYLPYAEIWYAHNMSTLVVAFGCIAAAGAILWSILPRRDRFEAPGPLLDPAKNPRLENEIHAIARTVGQEAPAEIYLLSGIDLWVAQRGGFMGFGSRRVMGLGLPLMGILTVPQLRAAFAHELGHFHRGDAALGPWIHNTRSALVRTLRSLGERRPIATAPFEWYANLFMRLTQAVSRRQELAADALAARTAGAVPLADGLRAVFAASTAYDAYVTQELMPLVRAGFRPPIAEGFARFVKAPGIASLMARKLDEQSAVPPANPYDTHPPLRARLEAIEAAVPGDAGNTEGEPALTLLADVPEEEARLLASMPVNDDGLILVSWSEVGEKVYLPVWRSLVSQESAALMGMTPANLPETIRQPRAFGTHAARVAKRVLQPEEAARFAASSIGAALLVRLVAEGWRLHVEPGRPVEILRDSDRLEPFSICPRLVSGDLSADDWRRFCASSGIGSLELWKLPAGPPPGVDTRPPV